ncbi:MAG: hypothetical protein AAF481_11245 [Acidobacteriota bacterium]
MPDRHLTLSRLLRVYEGEESPRELAEFALNHLRAICSECDEGYAAYARAKAHRRRPPRAVDFGAALDKAAQESAAQRARLAHDEKRARREVTDLLALPADQWPQKIDKARARYSTPAAASALLAESRRELRDRPAFALELLTAARRVAERIEPGHYGPSLTHEMRVRTAAHQANGLRVLGELRGADALWPPIHAHLAEHPLDDAAIRAELASLEASLRQDQRRLDEAEALLLRAEALYRKLEDRQGVAKVLVKRSTVSSLAGNFDATLEALAEAGAWLDSEVNSGLAWTVLHNRAICLCDLERFEEAERCLLRNQAQGDSGLGVAAEVSHTWLAGRIAAGLGKTQEARELLGRTRNEYLRRRLPFRAATVSLDLAALLLAAGETFEVKRLAQQTARTFERQSVHPQVARALDLFQSAATAEELTTELLAEVRLRFAIPRRLLLPAD